MKSRIFRAPDGSSTGAAPSEAATLSTAPAVGAHASAPLGPIKIAARDVCVFYGEKQALFDVSLEIPDKTVTALVRRIFLVLTAAAARIVAGLEAA